MHAGEVWRLARALTLVGAVAIATGTVAPSIVGDVPAVLADDKRDKDDQKNEKSKKNVGTDRDEDRVLRGQVLEIDTLTDPPQLILATADGSALVKVLKTDEIAINGVRLGDHLELTGEKIHELLFEATEISVAERYAAVVDAKNNDNDD